jgi:hypothetical protein
VDEVLKGAVLEIAELVKTLPEAVQPKAFEMLLNLEIGSKTRKHNAVTDKPSEDPEIPSGTTATETNKTDASEDLQPADLHVKARKFLERYSLTMAQLNGLFYKEDGKFMPLYEDLKTTKTSESQIRIALLLALRKGMQNGDFEFDGEVVRQECITRKCYDATNFTKIFNNNAALFDGLEAYSKSTPLIRLGEEGKKALASLIKELQ